MFALRSLVAVLPLTAGPALNVSVSNGEDESAISVHNLTLSDSEGSEDVRICPASPSGCSCFGIRRPPPVRPGFKTKRWPSLPEAAPLVYPDGISLWPSGDTLLRPATPKSRSSGLSVFSTKSALFRISVSLSRRALVGLDGPCRTVRSSLGS